MLSINGHLVVFFLHWNHLKAKGGEYIGQAMIKNNSLQILDLSYCSIGGSKNFNPSPSPRLKKIE